MQQLLESLSSSAKKGIQALRERKQFIEMVIIHCKARSNHLAREVRQSIVTHFARNGQIRSSRSCINWADSSISNSPDEAWKSERPSVISIDCRTCVTKHFWFISSLLVLRPTSIHHLRLGSTLPSLISCDQKKTIQAIPELSRVPNLSSIRIVDLGAVTLLIQCVLSSPLRNKSDEPSEKSWEKAVLW
jgi:hypothetical protein